MCRLRRRSSESIYGIRQQRRLAATKQGDIMGSFSFKAIGSALVATSALFAASLPAAQPAAPGAPPAAAAPAAPYAMPANIPDYIKKAVESSGRTAEMKARDANRKPAELLALSGVKPGDRVIEFASFGQYFTTLLSEVVGQKGLVYMYDLPYLEQRTGAASKAFVAAHPNSHFEVGDFNAVELPQSMDGVFIVLYYHDLLIQKLDTAKFNQRVFKALKPGGVYFIVDHNAEAGGALADALKIHRIDPAVIKQEVKAAGFELVEDSKLLANPADDHKQMVFGGMRGVTDQSVFKFRKPLK
jgi:predicted methyltransferase